MKVISGRRAAAIPVARDRWKALPPGKALTEEAPDTTHAWELGILAFPVSREPDSGVETVWDADDVMRMAADATSEPVSPMQLERLQCRHLGLKGTTRAWSMSGTGAIVHWTQVLFK